MEAIQEIKTIWSPINKCNKADLISKYEWQKSKTSNQSRLIIECVINENKYTDLKFFSSALRRAKIIDNKAINLPGSVIIHPEGVKILDRFREIIRKEYIRYNLVEYDYPLAAPIENFHPVHSELNLYNKLLNIVTDEELRKGCSRAILCPTGEEIIYPHWKQIVNNELDLPIKMFRNTKYFRPTSSGRHSGMSVFKAMESSDIFEFHCCYASDSEQKTALFNYLEMLKGIAKIFHVPMLWTTRPIWTNNHKVSNWTIGGDVPLPNGLTIQASCLYNQEQKFSKPYGIGFKKNGQFNYTNHLAGAITKRLILSHLLLGMKTNGEFFLHPNVAPTQVAIIHLAGLINCNDEIKHLGLALDGKLIRQSTFIIENKKKWNSIFATQHSVGTPLIVVIVGKRKLDDYFKIVFFRTDTDEEYSIFVNDFEELLVIIPILLKEIGLSYEYWVQEFFNNQCNFVISLENLKETIMKKKIGICPILPTKANVLEVASWKMGEILGFSNTDEKHECIFTGEITRSIAFISSRI